MTTEEPVLRPPGTFSTREHAGGARRYGIWLAFALALALALGVLFYLPRLTAPGDRTQVPTVPVPGAMAEPPGAVAANPKARAEAEGVLREYLAQYARLELDRAPVWGEPEWSTAGGEAQKGDRFFGQNDYGDARDAYARGFDLLLNLEASRPQRLAAALEAGQKALASEEAQSAVEQFELALAMAPENEVAMKGVARARVRGDVLGLLQTGRDAEGQGDLEAARRAYAKASELDGEYVQAVDALQRVTAVIVDERFRAYLSQALRALDTGRFGESGEALDGAASLKPDDPSLRDLRQRLAAARKRSALAALRQKAGASAAAEDWQAAAVLYKKALAIAPGATFAQEGARRAGERLRLHAQIDHYLSDPTRLYSDVPLSNAQQLLAAAGSAPPDEPRLAEKTARLRRHVVDARTPISVSLRSDGETDVVIYHVGRRGRFRQQQLALRPGTYTATGSRSGYRDVRKVFDVKPGVPLPAVVIQCEERI